MMLYIIVYILLVYGISFAFVESMGLFNMFHHIREFMGKIHSTFADLFNCMFCFPTWVGLILSLINIFLTPAIPFTPFMILFDMPWYMTIIGDMFMTASSVYIIHTIVSHFTKEEDLLDDGE